MHFDVVCAQFGAARSRRRRNFSRARRAGRDGSCCAASRGRGHGVCHSARARRRRARTLPTCPQFAPGSPPPRAFLVCSCAVCVRSRRRRLFLARSRACRAGRGVLRQVGAAAACGTRRTPGDDACPSLSVLSSREPLFLQRPPLAFSASPRQACACGPAMSVVR